MYCAYLPVPHFPGAMSVIASLLQLLTFSQSGLSDVDAQHRFGSLGRRRKVPHKKGGEGGLEPPDNKHKKRKLGNYKSEIAVIGLNAILEVSSY